MFNPFARKPYSPEAVSEAYNIPSVDSTFYEPKEDSTDGYTIGNNNGRTVMHVKSGYTTITMTLSEQEVRRMVRLLEASLDEDDSEDPTEVDTYA